jgi:hypothetical protein
MAGQLQNAPIQTDDSNYPRLTHTAEGEELITEAAAQTDQRSTILQNSLS